MSVERRLREKKFSITNRMRSFVHAGRGIWLFFKTTHNAWLDVAVLLVAVTAGGDFQISLTDWMFLTFAAALVFSAEEFNTAIEIDMDLTSPEFHPYARDTKDVTAGAVLIAGIAAFIIGVFIFGPYVLELLRQL